MASSIHFSKYTSFGNNFLIVDESDRPLADDEERAVFARWALNGDFGIGGTDNVLYLRAADDGHGVFRIFEHDGSETLSCGNGLLSSAAFLARTSDRSSWTVLTELPTGTPQPVDVGVEDRGAWVRVGPARSAPPGLYRRTRPAVDEIDEVEDLVIALPQGVAWTEGLPDKVTLRGLLTFTGEPHLVLFRGEGFPAEIEDHVFVSPERAAGTGIGLPKVDAVAHSEALVHRLGLAVKDQYPHLFPEGVHLNFARLLPGAATIEYRTWERAIDRETLACGSGAVAMAHVAAMAGLVGPGAVEFRPHRCRWYRPDAALQVVPEPDGFVLHGRPELVCDGVVPRPPAGAS